MIHAETGSGKSTVIPGLLLEALSAGAAHAVSIIVTQPRRLAARLLATEVARRLGEPVGRTVGFETRHERAVSDGTRIRFVTEGLLLRRIAVDPRLREVDAVILDEAHERTLEFDLLLGFIRRARERRGTGPGLILMSATIDAARLSARLDAVTVSVEGRLHPVEVEYEPAAAAARPIAPRAATAALHCIRRLGRDASGLVFMPGAREIGQTIRALERAGCPLPAVPLHGSLSRAGQDRAVRDDGTARVIVATNVAETSITVPGVRWVVDSGLARLAGFDAARGFDTLHVAPISQASALQRSGRAGRTAPGLAVRLWSDAAQRTRPEATVPEVHRRDLAGALLQLACGGEDDPAAFPWIDPPTPEALDRAARELRELGALDGGNRPTAHGRRMADLPAPPRLARFLLDAAAPAAGPDGPGQGPADAATADAAADAAVWAAIAQERDPLRGAPPEEAPMPAPGEPESDLALRAWIVGQARTDPGRWRGRRAVDSGAVAEIERSARQFQALLGRPRAGLPAHAGTRVTEALLRALVRAFPDRLAVRPSAESLLCRMPPARAVELDAASVVRADGPLISLDVTEVGDGQRRVTRLRLVTSVPMATVESLCAAHLHDAATVEWDSAQERVVRRLRRSIGPLVLSERTRPAEAADAAPLLARMMADGTLRPARWDDAVESWIARVRAVRRWFPDRGLIAYDEEDLAVIRLEIVDGCVSRRQVEACECLAAVRSALGADGIRFVETNAPASITLPCGRRLSLVYDGAAAAEGGPVGAARIQELYGLAATPTVGGGRIPVTLEILAPNNRPIQRTSDLAGFWRTLYPQLRNELRRRYPRHEWREAGACTDPPTVRRPRGT